MSATFQPIFRFTIFFFFSLFLNAVTGQASIRFSHLTTKDGLSQNSVLCIHQDSYGFMWFGTRDGLNLYDGITFKTFYHNYFDSNMLGSSCKVSPRC
ncbi:MAG: two-component regulator propeller domain-containing protein [Bacteroidales bacterium]